jgi:hypothetical protein
MIQTDDIIGIFDLDTASVSVHTRNYLKKAQEAGVVFEAGPELPKSFVVTDTPTGQKVYLSALGSLTLEARSKQFGL